jgi:hypothetical protein
MNSVSAEAAGGRRGEEKEEKEEEEEAVGSGAAAAVAVAVAVAVAAGAPGAGGVAAVVAPWGAIWKVALCSKESGYERKKDFIPQGK